MSALKPDKLVIFGVLALAGVWLLGQRRALAAGNTSAAGAVGRGFFVAPSQAGAGLEQQARTAGQNAGILAGFLGGLINQGTLQPSVVTPEARQAVRYGDDYYGSTYAPDSAAINPAPGWDVGGVYGLGGY